MNAYLHIPNYAGELTKTNSVSQVNHLKSARFWVAVMIGGLVLSGLTAFPLQTEVHLLASIVRSDTLRPIAESTHLLGWIDRVEEALSATSSSYPFLFYGTDWLAFAHVVIAFVFVGAYREPVRNRWLITFGLVACAAVLPLALIAGHVRGIPLAWRFVDCSFGVIGSIPLLICRQHIQALEKVGARRTRPITQMKRLLRIDAEENCSWLR